MASVEEMQGGGEQQQGGDYGDYSANQQFSNGHSGEYQQQQGEYASVDGQYGADGTHGNKYSTPYTPQNDPNDTFNVFVGDINLEVTEDDLKETFSPCGPVKSVLIFRDRVTNEPKGFGFVHFQTKAAQQVALSEEYNHIMIKGRACRVRSEQKTTLFVGNIPKTMTVREVHDTLYQLVGANMDVELKTGPPPVSESRGFAFVTFGNHPTADKARKLLVSATMKERPLNVSWAEPQEDADADTMATVKTLYVSNLHANVSDNVLRSTFGQYGEIINCAIVRNPQTKESRGFAFIEFKERQGCVSAMDALNGAQLEGQAMTIVLAKPPPKPNKGEKGCFRCGGDGHISKDCPNDASGGRGKGGMKGGRGGGGFLKSAPQFNSNGQMNPYVYDPETQQYIYLEQSTWNRVKYDLGLNSGPGPMRHGGRGRGRGGGGSNYQTYTAAPPPPPPQQQYYQQAPAYDYSAYQYPQQYQYPPQYAQYDYSQQAAQPAATTAAPATTGAVATTPAAPGQYAQAHADYTQTRYAPY